MTLYDHGDYDRDTDDEREALPSDAELIHARPDADGFPCGLDVNAQVLVSPFPGDETCTECALASAKREQAKRDAAELASLRAALPALRAERDSLTAEVVQLRRDLDDAGRCINGLRLSVRDLTDERDRLRDDWAAMKFGGAA